MLPLTPTLVAFDSFCSGEWDIRERATTESEISTRAERNRYRCRDAAVAFRREFKNVEECIQAVTGFYISARKCDITPNGANDFVHELCSEPEFLFNLAEQLCTKTYAPELAFTAQVVIRRLREQRSPEYLVTAQAAARSTDINLVRSAALGMWGIKYDPANVGDQVRSCN